MSWAGRLHLLALWLRGRTLGAAEYGAAYDAVAPTYPEWERLMAPHIARLADPTLLLAGAEVLDLAVAPRGSTAGCSRDEGRGSAHRPYPCRRPEPCGQETLRDLFLVAARAFSEPDA
jgi:hypothetical protein